MIQKIYYIIVTIWKLPPEQKKTPIRKEWRFRFPLSEFAEMLVVSVSSHHIIKLV